ncbi:MAG: hypothetical protein AB7I30_07660 [Isosphaeraceae bacterium]
MPRPSRAFRPGTSLLESRVPLSAGLVSQPAALVSKTHSKHVAGLSASLTGSYISTAEDNRPADGVLPIALNASGNVRGLGRMTLTGTLDFGGFRPAYAPDVTGTVTLTNARGSLTLQLSGTGGHGPIPERNFNLNASIVSGTGAYANVRGIGTVGLRFGSNTIFCITTPCPIAGNLKVSLNLRPPSR